MGDGASGLTLIVLAIVAILLTGGLVSGFLVARAAMRRRPRTRLTGAVGVVGGLAGVALTGLASVWMFNQPLWSPPPRLTLRMPPDFAERSVILLEDPQSPRTLDWRGWKVPLFSQSATLTVPASGVVRLHDFGPMKEATYVDVRLAERGYATMAGGGSPPPGIDATRNIEIALSPDHNDFILDPDAQAAEIRSREAGRARR